MSAVQQAVGFLEVGQSCLKRRGLTSGSNTGLPRASWQLNRLRPGSQHTANFVLGCLKKNQQCHFVESCGVHGVHDIFLPSTSVQSCVTDERCSTTVGNTLMIWLEGICSLLPHTYQDIERKIQLFHFLYPKY